MSEQMKPCPFCGSQDITQIRTDDSYWQKCRNCEATGPIGFKRHDEDDPNWNTRADLQAARAVPDGWVSVKDRLPKEGDAVLVYEPRRSPPIQVNEYWRDYEAYKDENEWGVTHWMPLPKPPIAREGE
jgi:Lar family restriction alleviation protein